MSLAPLATAAVAISVEAMLYSLISIQTFCELSCEFLPVTDRENNTSFDDFFNSGFHTFNLWRGGDDSDADLGTVAFVCHQPIFLKSEVLRPIDTLERLETM